MPYFEVHADNGNRYNTPTVSYVKAVHVHVRMLKISILEGGTVQVRCSTPITDPTRDDRGGC